MHHLFYFTAQVYFTQHIVFVLSCAFYFAERF